MEFRIRTATLVLLPALFLLLSCKKESVDSREDYIGTYDYTFIVVGQDDFGSYSADGDGVLTIQKGNAGDELIFDDGSEEYPAKLDGTTFTIPTFVTVADDELYEISGAGFFQDDKVQFNLDFKATDFFDESTASITGAKR